MMLSEYLKKLDDSLSVQSQLDWYQKLKERSREGLSLFENANYKKQEEIRGEFRNRVRTEELKAWYGAPDGDILFQGTSISSLTIPCKLPSPLHLEDISDLEEAIANSYIELHDEHAAKVRNAIMEDVEDWISSGLYYGVAIGSKVISQAFHLAVPYRDVVFKVKDHLVDPHEIISYPQDVREEYFKAVKDKIKCFGPMNLRQEEMEASLILADISKPKLEEYRDKIILTPVRCNEVATCLACSVKELIIEKTSGRIKPKSLAVVIYDTDTPYTYHHLLGCNGNPCAPILPGLTVLGASGTIEALRWLYTYRISLIAQKMMKSSIYSEVHSDFIPFIFYGVLVPRDAEILLDLENLDKLRYRGNISPQIEFCYLLSDIAKYLNMGSTGSIRDELDHRAR